MKNAKQKTIRKCIRVDGAKNIEKLTELQATEVKNNCLNRNKVVCVLSFRFLSCMQENLIALIAFYS